MFCCTVLVSLIAVPMMILRRYCRPRPANALAWRLGAPDPSRTQPERPVQRFGVFIRNRARSFVFAGAGIRHVIRHEPAALIHAAATVGTLGAATLLEVTAEDWRWIVFAVLAVWSAEAFNTAIESTCNLLSPHFSEHVRIAKDAGAGAVLLISLGALAIGGLTFWPYLVTGVLPTQVPPQLAATLCRAAP
jgi:diacylglycerol kinase (ATP)